MSNQTKNNLVKSITSSKFAMHMMYNLDGKGKGSGNLLLSLRWLCVAREWRSDPLPMPRQPSVTRTTCFQKVREGLYMKQHIHSKQSHLAMFSFHSNCINTENPTFAGIQTTMWINVKNFLSSERRQTHCMILSIWSLRMVKQS